MTDGLELAGQVALVTGASRRIGRAVALRLAARGAAVAVNARASRAAAEAVAGEIGAQGGRAVAALGDVTDPEATRTMVATIAEQLGGLDILVHNAVVRGHGTLEELELDAWRRTLSVVLDGAFLCAKHAVPHMERAGRGSIVFIGGASAYAGSPDLAIPTAKAGLDGLTRSLAVALGPKGIRVNLLSPGRIESDEDDPGRRAEVVAARPSSNIPLRRPGSTEDVARAVVALVGPDFAYLTGQTIHLTGGLVMR